MSGTRERLVDLAEKAMRSRGYGGFSYADLAEQAGIRKASVHHHFPAKSDLGLAVIEHYAAGQAEALDAIAAVARTGGEALRAVIDHYREGLNLGASLCLCCVLAGEREHLDDPMRATLERTNRATVERLAETLRRGRQDRSISVPGDPAIEASAILAQLQGAHLLARAAGDWKRFDEATETLRARLFRH